MPAPIFDAVSGTTGNTISLTFSHTVGVGDDRVLIVFASSEDITAYRTVTSVTYNGVALTKLGDVSALFGSQYSKASAWLLAAPATGANNVVVTWDGAAGGVIATALSFRDARQVNPVRTPIDTNSGNSISPSLAVNSAIDDMVIDLIHTAGGRVFTVGSGQTQRLEQTSPAHENNCSTEPAVGISTVMDWTLNSASDFLHIGVALKPPGGSLKHAAVLFS